MSRKKNKSIEGFRDSNLENEGGDNYYHKSDSGDYFTRHMSSLDIENSTEGMDGYHR